MARKFVRAFDKSRPIQLEPGGGPMLIPVDQSYETTEHLVMRMIEAGERLEAARAKGFDFADGVDTGPQEEELLRQRGADLADVSVLGEKLTGRLAEQKAAAGEAAKKAAGDAREALKAELRAELAKEQAGAGAAPPA